MYPRGEPCSPPVVSQEAGGVTSRHRRISIRPADTFLLLQAPIVMGKCAIGAIGIRTVVCVWQGVRIDTPEVHYAWHSTLGHVST